MGHSPTGKTSRLEGVIGDEFYTNISLRGTNFRLASIPVMLRVLQSDDAAKVLQAETLPSFRPAVNQRCRCAEEPWVKASGTT